MIQEIYQKAMKYAGEQHKDQKVPGSSANYLLHISNVTMEVILAHKMLVDFDLEYAIQVAILHDTIEDTSTTFEALSERFGLEVAQGVQALTKNESLGTKREQMLDSLGRIVKHRKEVAIVKLADRITNLQSPPSHWSKEKIQNYLEEAREIQEKLKGNNAYLDKRIDLKIRQYEQYI